MNDADAVIDVHGHCLCGAVQIHARSGRGITACHCSMCRRWAGGPLFAVHAVGTPRIEGADHVVCYRSSDWAERAFCRQCGSSLYYRLLPNPSQPDGEYILAGGMLDLTSDSSFDQEIFIDHKPDWYGFEAESTRRLLTEQEVLAAFSQPA